MFKLLKLIYRFGAVSVKIPVTLFRDIKKKLKICIDQSKQSLTAKVILNDNNNNEHASGIILDFT